MKQRLTSVRKVLDGTRAALEEELQRELRERTNIAAEQLPADTVELMMDSVQREITLHELESKSHLLRNVRDALDRITVGTYGSCVYCGQRIADKRLEAVPWTRSCIGCQEQLERN
jgi:DnaK suppressor protein